MARLDQPPEIGSRTRPGGPEGLYGLTPELVGAVRAALADSDGDRVRALVAPLHEADVADLIERFRAGERRRLIAIAHDVLSGDVLPHVEDEIREELIGEIGAERAAEAIADMETDDAVAVLEDLDDPQRKEILDAISSEERAGVAESLTYPEDSAGRLMQRELVSLPAFWTVGQTIDHMRETGGDMPDDFYEIYVIDPHHRPIGRIPLHRLLRTRRPVRLRDIMATDLKAIPAGTDQEEVGHVFDQYDLVSAPVIGETGRLIGVITVDDVVDVIQEEAEQDILRLSGVKEPDIYRAALRTATRPLHLAAGQSRHGDSRVAGDLPVRRHHRSDGGARGAHADRRLHWAATRAHQTMTVAVRAIATKDLTTSNVLRVLWKELLVGGINGVVFAILIGVARRGLVRQYRARHRQS